MKTDPDTVDISILNVAISEDDIDTKKGDVLPPAAYNSLNVGNIVSVFEALQSGMNFTAKAGAWKAKLAAGDEATKEVQEDLGKDIEAGKLTLPIDQSFKLEDVNDALAKMKANEHFGKITLVVD